jgi:hypothetical protein
MGTISRARASVGLTASGTPTKTNVTGAVEIGVPQFTSEFTDANIAYSFKVTATGASDVATLTYSTGVVAQTTGTPTIDGGDGLDFEGATLPTMVTAYALLLTAPSTNSAAVVFSGGVAVLPGGVSFSHFGSGLTVGSSALSITFSSFGDPSGDTVKVTIIGKSS